MLNKAGERELCYITLIDAIEPIEGSDNCECAVVGGWRVMVRKNEFKKGDPAIYFEIDSYLDPSNPAFAFMEKKKYKVKTQRYTFGGKGNFISQGLLMSAANFGWSIGHVMDQNYTPFIMEGNQITIHHINDESRFLTKQLGVTYATAEDNTRKAASADKYKKMAQRHGKLFSKQPFRWLMKRTWGKKLLFIFFGKKKDKKSEWPSWVVKTDEERIENRTWTLKASDVQWVANEKIDGTSTTFYLSRPKGLKKGEYLVCSRNVVFDTPEKGRNNYYMDTLGNVYLEMSEKYNVKAALEKLLANRPSAEWVAVQAETFGMGVQKRDYGMKDHEIRAFNLRYSDCGRVGTLEMRDALEPLGIPCVPIISEAMILPSTVEELREFVHSAPSAIDGGMKEGIVFRSLDGSDSFKCVDPEFLVKFHQ